MMDVYSDSATTLIHLKLTIPNDYSLKKIKTTTEKINIVNIVSCNNFIPIMNQPLSGNDPR